MHNRDIRTSPTTSVWRQGKTAKAWSLFGAAPSVTPGGCSWAGERCPCSLQLQREGCVGRLWGCSPQACTLVSFLLGRVSGLSPVSQHLLGICGGLLSHHRQRRAGLALLNHDSANPHLAGAAGGLQGRRAARQSSSAVPSASPKAPAPHLLLLPSSTLRHGSVSNPGSAGCGTARAS